MSAFPLKACLAGAMLLIAVLPAFAAAPKVEPKTKDQFGDWSYVCEKATDKNAGGCEITQTQTVKDKNGKPGRLLRLSMAKRDGKTYVLHALLPLGLHIPAGVAVKVDENDQKPMALQRCTNLGCEAIMTVDETLVAQMKKGDKLKVGINVGAKTMVIPAPLKGISEALAALK